MEQRQRVKIFLSKIEMWKGEAGYKIFARRLKNRETKGQCHKWIKNEFRMDESSPQEPDFTLLV